MSLSVVEQTSFFVRAKEFSRAYAAWEKGIAVRTAIASHETGSAFAPPFFSSTDFLWRLPMSKMRSIFI